MTTTAASLLTAFLQMWSGDRMHDEWGWEGWIAMVLMMLLFWGGIAALALFALRAGTSHSHPASGPSPLDIARERYARGEIGDEELERIKRGLR